MKLWLDQLVGESHDPLLALSWLPDMLSMKVTAFLHIKLHSNDKDRLAVTNRCTPTYITYTYPSHSIEVEILPDNKIIVKNGTATIELTTDKERLCRCVRQQVK